MKTVSYDFKSIEWGSDEAKGDVHLSSYFLRIPQYEELFKGKYRYIIGRKGTGKTAIIEQLKTDIDAGYNRFYKYLSLKDFPIQDLRNLKDKSAYGKSQFVPIWTFLMLVELCQLLIEDQSVADQESVKEIKTFINDNFSSCIGFTDTVTRLIENNNKVAVLPSWIKIESSNSSSLSTTDHIQYNKVTQILLSKIQTVQTESSYYILFDELDEGYKAGDKNLNLLLLALLRSVENTYIDLKSYLNYIPVLALRSDIFENLEDNDLNKLDDYIINLKWTKEYGSQYSLYALVNARINASIKTHLPTYDPDRAWRYVAYDEDPEMPIKIGSLWRFIQNKTFERPRDIIKYMKCCSKVQSVQSGGPITYRAVKEAEAAYSEWFYKEFRDEIQSHLPIWKEVCNAITKLGKPIFTLREIEPFLKSNPEVSNYIDSNCLTVASVMEIMFNFGLIGTYSKKWLFKYKDHNLPFDEKKQMILHFGFAKKLRINTYY